MHYDLISSDYDQKAPHPRQPATSYLICSVPRSGSTLLCEGLTFLGELGTPLEYFNGVFMRPLSRRWGCRDAREYAEALKAYRQSAAGCVGIKAHWDQFAAFIKALAPDRHVPGRTITDQLVFQRETFESYFPNTKYLFTTRYDTVRQAISWWIAARTGQWMRYRPEVPDATRQLEYDFDQIHAYHLSILLQASLWRDYFSVNNVRPYVLVYEDFAANYTDKLRETADYLGCTIEPGRPISPPRMIKQRTSRSDEFVWLYRRDLAQRAASGETPWIRLFPAVPPEGQGTAQATARR